MLGRSVIFLVPGGINFQTSMSSSLELCRIPGAVTSPNLTSTSQDGVNPFSASSRNSFISAARGLACGFPCLLLFWSPQILLFKF